MEKKRLFFAEDAGKNSAPLPFKRDRQGAQYTAVSDKAQRNLREDYNQHKTQRKQ